MNIIFLSSEFPPGPGGIGAHAYNLAYQLAENKNQVTIYASDRPDYPSNDFDREQKFEIFRYPIYLGSAARLIHLVKFLWKQRKGYDWIILSGLTNLVLYNLISLIIKSRVLCVVHGHEIIMAKGVSRFFVRRSLTNSDCVVAVSDFSKNLLNQNGISRPVITIPNGVNVIKGVKPKSQSEDKLVLITVGSVTKRKGQHNVVAALPDIIKRFGNVEYHIVGIPRQKEEIESLTQKLGVSNQVFLHGAVNDEQRNVLISKADIFMMLSENLPDGDVEGFGIAVLEANGLGLPAIGSKDTGVEQAIHHGLSGYLVDSQNPDQICNSIDLILERYEKFSEESIAWAHRHDWEIIGKMYLTILNGTQR